MLRRFEALRSDPRPLEAPRRQLHRCDARSGSGSRVPGALLGNADSSLRVPECAAASLLPRWRSTRRSLTDVLMIVPVIHGDERGFFHETYRRDQLAATPLRSVEFVQENHSRSPRVFCGGCTFRSVRG